ncbi:MAG: D-alanyl-lipoteichoic acid biosynthesis protein DltD [Coriobacteriaceae bacterium]|nr:D-alanyl-lipoteichoic acid biosynthesis protein DltD [Coriobacteriaceae bacterium]
MKNLAAIAISFITALAVVFGMGWLLPPQTAIDPARVYGYLCSGVKSESIAFTLAACTEETYFLFGSSELATMPWMVSTVPDHVFRENDYNMDLMYIGDAYDQSLWLAIAAGAYAPGMPNKKVAVIVSPQWFFDGGLEPGIFKMRFSYNLYQEFCKNPAISQESKDFVAQRLAQEGVDAALIDAGQPKLPQDWVNGVALNIMTDLRLRFALGEVRAQGSPRTPAEEAKAIARSEALLPSGQAESPSSSGSVPEMPDFDVLREQAIAQAQQHSTNNPYGVFDDYWTDILEPRYEALEGSLENETLSQTPEYDDFRCLLDVCRESGLDPYVVIAPVNGKWYDYTGLTPDVRASFSSRIVALCADAEVTCLDLSPHDYDTYYLRDIMHLGWLGWLDVEQGFLSFVRRDS